MLKLNIRITVSESTLATMRAENHCQTFSEGLAKVMNIVGKATEVDVSVYWYAYPFAHNAPGMSIRMDFAHDNASLLVSEAQLIASPIPLLAFVQRNVDMLPKDIMSIELYSQQLGRKVIHRLPL